MANGIAKNEKERKSIKKPAEQYENSLVCVARVAKTDEKALDGAGKEIRGCKEQIRAGEYVVIKLKDEPVQVADKAKQDKPEQGKDGNMRE